MFSFEKVSEQPLLLFLMEPVGDLLGDQGSVAAGAVFDDEIHPDFVFCGLLYDFSLSSIISEFQHARDHFVEREGGGTLPKVLKISSFIRSSSARSKGRNRA